MFILPTHSFALLPAPPRNIKSPKTGSFARTSPAAGPSPTPGRNRVSCTQTSLPPRPRLPSAPRVTWPNGELSSSPSSGLPERTRKCPGAGAGPSGRAVRAFVPPAAGLPRRRHSQYVSPRLPALPPPALACHALPSVAGSWLPLGSRAGYRGKRPPSPYALREARSGGVERREDLRPAEGCGACPWNRLVSLWAPLWPCERPGPGWGCPVSGDRLGPGSCLFSTIRCFPGPEGDTGHERFKITPLACPQQ